MSARPRYASSGGVSILWRAGGRVSVTATGTSFIATGTSVIAMRSSIVAARALVVIII